MVQVNLKNVQVPIRERRLGAVNGYEGTAADLVQRSRDGTLKDRARTFTQCTSCSSVTALCQLCLIQDAAVVNHAPVGCAGDFPNFNTIQRAGQLLRGLPVHTLRVVSSNLQEKDIIYGGARKLEAAVRTAKQRFAPKAIFITTSCASGIIGDDVEGIAAALEKEIGIPVVPVPCDGFRSRVWATGFDAAYHAILSRIVKPAVKKNVKINIINFWGSDVFGGLLGRLGLAANYVTPFTTIERLERLSESMATVQVCHTLGTYLAAGLEQRFGVPEIKAPAPYGIPATDAWLRELGRVTDRSPAVERLIAEEKERVLPEIAELSARLSGVRAFIAAGAVHAHSILCILGELGIKTVSACAWHHDVKFDNDDPRSDTLDIAVKSYGDVPFGLCDKQSYELANLLKRLSPDIFIVRHTGMSVWGAKLGIPTFLMGDEQFGLGYQGILNYGRKIDDTISNPSFVKNIARHARLPYTDWWLAQEPFSFLRGGKNG